MTRALIVALVLLILGETASAEETVFFDRSRDGWFWYLQDRPVAPRWKPTPPSLPPSVKAMRERAEELLAQAIETPTEARVAAYMAYQQQLTQRSEQFARIWQRVLWQHPELDPTVADPVATAGLSPAQADRIKTRDTALSDLARTSGLFYFFSGQCAVCEIQSSILAAFAEAYGFRVIAVSVDGAGDPVFADAKVDRGAAARLEVSQVPAIFLARPPSDIIRVGTGLLALEELAGRLVRLNEREEEPRDEEHETKSVVAGDDRHGGRPPVELAGPGRFAAATE